VKLTVERHTGALTPGFERAFRKARGEEDQRHENAARHQPALEGARARDVVELPGLRQQVFIAGMTAGDGKGGVLGDGSMYSQAKETFTKIKHLVEAAGGTMNDIIRVDIYVTDIKQREEVWKARREFFTGDFPTSTLVEVRALATPQLLVEVNATGFLGGSAG
jgi:enamine deaminase RidA (YjgF/YER057c/UK114 family)